MDELEEIRKKKLKEMEERYLRKEEVIDKPIEVTDQTFDDTIKKYPAVVIDFWAPWCPPCRMIAPIIEELAKNYSGKVVFGKLNVDGNQMVASRYGIMAVPTLLFFKNGRPVDRVSGALPKRALEERVKRNLLEF